MNVLIVNNDDLFNINVIIILLFILSITIHIIRVKKLSVKLIHKYKYIIQKRKKRLNGK